VQQKQERNDKGEEYASNFKPQRSKDEAKARRKAIISSIGEMRAAAAAAGLRRRLRLQHSTRRRRCCCRPDSSLQRLPPPCLLPPLPPNRPDVQPPHTPRQARTCWWRPTTSPSASPPPSPLWCGASRYWTASASRWTPGSTSPRSLRHTRGAPPCAAAAGNAASWAAGWCWPRDSGGPAGGAGSLCCSACRWPAAAGRVLLAGCCWPGAAGGLGGALCRAPGEPRTPAATDAPPPSPPGPPPAASCCWRASRSLPSCTRTSRSAP
jgi:hypothetical protein